MPNHYQDYCFQYYWRCKYCSCLSHRDHPAACRIHLQYWHFPLQYDIYFPIRPALKTSLPLKRFRSEKRGIRSWLKSYSAAECCLNTSSFLLPTLPRHLHAARHSPPACPWSINILNSLSSRLFDLVSVVLLEPFDSSFSSFSRQINTSG